MPTQGFIQYMRAHGNTPGPTQRPKLAGATTALIAGMPALLLLWRTGAAESLSQALAIAPWVVLALYWCVMALAGAIYGQVFSRAANDHCAGWLFGISYGFLLWMIGPVMALQWIIGRPVVIGLAAMGLLGSHLLYGLALGIMFPFIHHSLQSKLGDHMLQGSGESKSKLKRVVR